MLIIGCDFHAGFQQVAMLDTSTAEVSRRRLQHPEEAQAFYAALPGPVRVGVEACGKTQWFEQLLTELGHELWIGDAARIRALCVRQQKTDRRDAEHILDLLLTERFPRLWVPTPQERDVRQLLVHRHQRVRLRTQVKNQLHALAISQGVCRKRKLWSAQGRKELESLALLRQLWTQAGGAALQALPLLPFTAQRRQQLLATLDRVQAEIGELDGQVQQQAKQRPEVVRLMSHPGVGPNTALGFVLTIGDVRRFRRARQVASYLGLIPREHSSGGKQRLGHISKQGSAFMRFLLVEAGQSAAKGDAQLRRRYRRLAVRAGRSKAKVAIARQLAVRLYWMLRQQWNYAQLCRSLCR
jgi:transposase